MTDETVVKEPETIEELEAAIAAEQVEVAISEPATVPAKEPAPELEQKTVPLGALHEERARRQELQREKEAWAQEKQNYLLMLERLSKPALVETDAPVDLEEFVTRGILQDALAKLTNQPPLGPQEIRDFVHWELQEAKARETLPDYDAVVDPFFTAIKGAKPVHEEIVARAARQNKSAALVAYEMAKQWGIGGAEDGEKETPGPPKEEVLHAVKLRNQSQMPKSAGVKSGGTAPEPLTIEALVNLPQPEFEKVWSKLTEADRQRLAKGD